MSRNSLAVLGVLLVLGCGLAWPAAGQDAAAKPKAKAARAKPAAAKSDDAATPKPTAKPAAKPGASEDENSMVPATPALPDPVVEAVEATNPTTPAELLRAIKILAEVKPESAKKYIAQLMKAEVSDAQWAEISEAFGQGALLQLAGRKELLPEMHQLSERILQAATRHARDAQQLMELAKQVASTSGEARTQAFAGLEKAGPAGAAALVAVLADAARASEHAMARSALAELGSIALSPLLAALDAGDPALAAQAVRTLAMLKKADARLYLIAPLCAADSPPAVREAASAAMGQSAQSAGDRFELAGLLAARAQEYATQRQPFPGAIDGKVDVWHWDSAAQRAVSQTVLVEDAARIFAARLAQDAHRLAPATESLSVLYLTTMLEAAAYQAGLDSPLPEDARAAAAKFDARELEAALMVAMKADRTAAATALVRILGGKETAEKLLNRGAQRSPLMQAVRSPDRRLALAAADAAVRLRPTKPYAGSSSLTETLAFLAASTGTRRVLIASPSNENALRFAGMLTASGYALDIATSGNQALRMATTSPDYEFALLDTVIDGPPIDALVQHLRQDCRTTMLPIGLIARDGFLGRAEQLAETESRVLAFPRPHDAAGLKWETARLRALSPRETVPFEIRQSQAALAITDLAALAAMEQLYDLRRIETAALTALNNPKLGAAAAAVIGNIGTAESQHALVEMASRSSAPLDVRQAAVRAFAENTRRFGVLLTTAQIALQYERYNRSEKQEVATQRILGWILDNLEARMSPIKPAAGAKSSGKAGAEQGPHS